MLSLKKLRHYTFDTYTSKEESGRHYHIIQETDDFGAITMEWASGNSGFVTAAGMDGLADDPTLFPTYSGEDGRDGRCAKMVTRKPKSTLVSIFAPIAAGNLFTGVFGQLESLSKPALSTHFGEGNIFPYYPLSIEGYYKYKAGTGDYIGPDGNPRPGVIDSCALYAVFYKVDENLQSLDGNTVLDHPNIVSMAMLPDKTSTEGDEFVSFDIPFAQVNDIEVDFDKYTYKLAVVLSSSFWGQRYEGTPGSNLTVDNLEIISENEL